MKTGSRLPDGVQKVRASFWQEHPHTRFSPRGAGEIDWPRWISSAFAGENTVK
jgi:hypothetical protein